MTHSETYYAMAEYLREHGFSPAVGDDGGPRCFVGAKCSVIDSRFSWDFFSPLLGIVGTANLGEGTLAQAGWDEGSTERAAAACEVAGDIFAKLERDEAAAAIARARRSVRAEQAKEMALA